MCAHFFHTTSLSLPYFVLPNLPSFYQAVQTTHADDFHAVKSSVKNLFLPLAPYEESWKKAVKKKEIFFLTSS